MTNTYTIKFLWWVKLTHMFPSEYRYMIDTIGIADQEAFTLATSEAFKRHDVVGLYELVAGSIDDYKPIIEHALEKWLQHCQKEYDGIRLTLPLNLL